MAEDKPGSPERKCKTYNVIMAVINLLALTAALGIKSSLYGAAFPSWPLVLADGALFALLPKFRVERDGSGSFGLALGFGKRDFIKRAALIAAWLCACAAFVYGFRPDYTLAQAGDILRGEGYRGVRSAGFALRDWESETPLSLICRCSRPPRRAGARNISRSRSRQAESARPRPPAGENKKGRAREAKPKSYPKNLS